MKLKIQPKLALALIITDDTYDYYAQLAKPFPFPKKDMLGKYLLLFPEFPDGVMWAWTEERQFEEKYTPLESWHPTRYTHCTIK